MKLSIVIPVHNEEQCIESVVMGLIQELELLSMAYSVIKVVHSPLPKGFGRAIKTGLSNVSGEIIVIFMGDGSDDAADVAYFS